MHLFNPPKIGGGGWVPEWLNAGELRGLPVTSLRIALLQQGCRDGAVVAHPTSNQGDGGSIPTHGTYMFFHSKRIS